MGKIRTTASLLVFGVVCAGCNGLPRTASVVETRMVYAWPLDRCPSQPEVPLTERAPLLGSLLGILAGDVISALVGIPAAALTQAAEADKKGFTASGTNARFYYRATANLDTPPPGCYVIAYTEPGDGSAAPWCTDKGFAADTSESCKNGSPLIEGLAAKDELRFQREQRTKALKVPEIYAEIGFDRSGMEPIVRPRLVALYYPKSLLNASSLQLRTLNLSLNLTAPGSEAFKAASVALTLPGVKPGGWIAGDVLVNAQTAWSSLPTPKQEVKEPGSYFPVTMVATIHEIGDPNVFLAAFAKAVAGSTADFSKAISGAVLPAGREAAEQQANTNIANYTAARAAALKSNSDYLAACAKGVTTDAEKQAAEALFYAVIAARQKANIAAKAAEVQPPFDATTPSTRCFA